jgi:hypothetical protein
LFNTQDYFFKSGRPTASASRIRDPLIEAMEMRVRRKSYCLIKVLTFYRVPIKLRIL